MSLWIDAYARGGKCYRCKQWRPVVHVRFFSAFNVKMNNIAELMDDQEPAYLHTEDVDICEECVSFLEGRRAGAPATKKED
jgi:hypothetical protein